MLKAFTKSVKKVESIAFKKKYKEDGNTFSSFDLLFKHKEGEADKLGDLVKQIWNKKEIPSKSDLKALVKALVDLKDTKSDSKTKKKKKKSIEKETKSSFKSNKELEKKRVVATPEKNKNAPTKTILKKTANKADSHVKKNETIKPTKSRSKTLKKSESKSPVKEVKKTTNETSSKVKQAKPSTRILKKKTMTAVESKPATATKKAVRANTESKRAIKIPRVGDNLKLIEGIGPKIESFLKEEGIDTFAKLAQAVPSAMQTMLVTKGGSRYNAYNPAKWPEQARLAAAGKMEELKKLKDVLK
ncbi:MAG: putative flap endonuclease-1-like 5' DNA nuclease [Algoriphagus sp.]|jgi:predicted flap endonuclease-1-like 5' DNA nuclease